MWSIYRRLVPKFPCRKLFLTRLRTWLGSSRASLAPPHATFPTGNLPLIIILTLGLLLLVPSLPCPPHRRLSDGFLDLWSLPQSSSARPCYWRRSCFQRCFNGLTRPRRLSNHNGISICRLEMARGRSIPFFLLSVFRSNLIHRLYRIPLRNISLLWRNLLFF